MHKNSSCLDTAFVVIKIRGNQRSPLHSFIILINPKVPEAYLVSLEKIAALPVQKVFPAHHSLDIQPEILIRMRETFKELKEDGKLHHGSGKFDYGDWGLWL